MIHMACTHLNTSVVCRNVKWQHFILVTGLFYWSNIHKMKHDNIFIELKTEPNLTPDIMSTTISVKKIKIIIISQEAKYSRKCAGIQLVHIVYHLNRKKYSQHVWIKVGEADLKTLRRKTGHLCLSQIFKYSHVH